MPETLGRWGRPPFLRATPAARVGCGPGRGGTGIVEVRQGCTRKWFAHDALQRADHVVIFRCDECEGVAGPFCTPRTTNAMDIGIRRIGHIEIDDVRDALHVQSAGGNIGRDHDEVSAVFKSLQCRLALTLRAVTVQAGHFIAGALDLICQLLSPVFGTP